MKFALLTVTYSGLFYQGRALSVEQQIHKAKELGFTGLAIETKRPVASPLDLSKTDRERIKSVAANEGIELVAGWAYLPGVELGNDAVEFGDQARTLARTQHTIGDQTLHLSDDLSDLLGHRKVRCTGGRRISGDPTTEVGAARRRANTCE